MGRLLGIGLFVIALWVSAELYANGTDGAFDGAFARTAATARPVERSERAADAFQRAYNVSESRVDDALREPGDDR